MSAAFDAAGLAAAGFFSAGFAAAAAAGFFSVGFLAGAAFLVSFFSDEPDAAGAAFFSPTIFLKNKHKYIKILIIYSDNVRKIILHSLNVLLLMYMLRFIVSCYVYIV